MLCRLFTRLLVWRCPSDITLLLLLITLITSVSIRAEESEPLNTSLSIGTWGGPYQAAQQAAIFTPFELSNGVRIQTSAYTGGLDVFNQPTPPDVLDMLEEEADLACEKGLLKRFGYTDLLQAGKTTASRSDADVRNDDPNQDNFAQSDFHTGAFSPCSVAHITFSTVVAYDEREFTSEKPKLINDLFDLDRFPGKRALQRSPAALFEWAMMSEGVPVSQIYDLLSTERGLRLALKRMEKLRGHIIWWDTPSEAIDLLKQGEVVMASGYNGRFFDAWSHGLPINIIWDGQIIDRSVWAIPSASKIDNATALSFLRFALHPERLAHLARLIPYGPTRKSAFSYIGLHPDTGIVMSDHLPTADHHLASALQRDTRWYSRTSLLRDTYFSRWMNK